MLFECIIMWTNEMLMIKQNQRSNHTGWAKVPEVRCNFGQQGDPEQGYEILHVFK